ncbi:MAG: polysaccharide deacetylase family protein [Thiobacillaceae bacterium]
MYHRIGQAHNDWEGKYCVSPERFACQMRALAAHGHRAITLDDFVSWLEGQHELPKGSFLLTFDDGFLGVHDHAAPVLEGLSWPATVFLVSALTGKQDEWCRNENPSGATYPLLDITHIASLTKRGFSFHSHSRHHVRLSELTDAELEDELAGSRSELAALLGTTPDFLAYPYGLYDERVIQHARRAGYRAAFSVQPGFNRRGGDPFRIRRLDVFGTDTAAMLLRKLKLGSNDGSLAHSAQYFTNRMLARLGIKRH